MFFRFFEELWTTDLCDNTRVKIQIGSGQMEVGENSINVLVSYSTTKNNVDIEHFNLKSWLCQFDLLTDEIFYTYIH